MLRRLGQLRQNLRNAAQPNLINYQETKVTELANGLRIATEDMGGRTATIGLWIDCGTRYEKLNEMGTAHFFEHLVFKGSSLKTKAELENYAENEAVLMNAYTSREQTAYYFQARKEETATLVKLLADMVQNPTLQAGAIAHERLVIDHEFSDILNNYQEVIFDFVHAFCFGGLDGKYRDSSLSYNILGTRHHIKTLITQRMIKDFINIHYHPSRMVLVAAGACEHDAIVDLAKMYFTRTDSYVGPGTPTFERKAKPLKGDPYADFWGETKFHPCEIRQHYDMGGDEGTVSGSIVFPTIGWSHTDSMVIMLISQFIGVLQPGAGGASFSTPPMTHTLQQLCPQVSFQAYTTLYNDIGVFGILFTLFNTAATPKLNEIFIKELERLATELTEEELELSKKALLPNIALPLDGSQPVADEIGRHLLIYGRRIHYTEIECLVNSVTREDVSRCITKMLEGDRALCLIGNLSQVPTIYPDLPQIVDPEKTHEKSWLSEVKC